MAVFKKVFGIICCSIGLALAGLAIAMLADPKMEDRVSVAIFTFSIAAFFLVPAFLLLKGKSTREPKISKQERMEQAFYAAIHSGSIATIADYEFAVQNKVTRKEAREFLEQKALELGASADANDRGMVTYTFGG